MAPDCSFHFLLSSPASEKVSVAVNIQGLSIVFGNIRLLLTAWILRSSIKSMAWLMEVIKRLLSARREFTNLIYCGEWKRLSISCQKETISACMPFPTDNELVTGTLSCWHSGWSKAGAGCCHISPCQAAVARDEEWQWSKEHGENRETVWPPRGPAPPLVGLLLQTILGQGWISAERGDCEKIRLESKG